MSPSIIHLEIWCSMFLFIPFNYFAVQCEKIFTFYMELPREDSETMYILFALPCIVKLAKCLTLWPVDACRWIHYTFSLNHHPMSARNLHHWLQQTSFIMADIFNRFISSSSFLLRMVSSICCICWSYTREKEEPKAEKNAYDKIIIS